MAAGSITLIFPCTSGNWLWSIIVLLLGCTVHVYVTWRVVDDPYLRMLGKLCGWAESTWPTVGRLDRRGHAPIRTISTLWRSLTIPKKPRHTEAGFSPISTDSSCLRSYVSLRCLDLPKWRFSYRERRRRQTIALPLAHASSELTIRPIKLHY